MKPPLALSPYLCVNLVIIQVVLVGRLARVTDFIQQLYCQSPTEGLRDKRVLGGQKDCVKYFFLNKIFLLNVSLFTRTTTITNKKRTSKVQGSGKTSSNTVQ